MAVAAPGDLDLRRGDLDGFLVPGNLSGNLIGNPGGMEVLLGGVGVLFGGEGVLLGGVGVLFGGEGVLLGGVGVLFGGEGNLGGVGVLKRSFSFLFSS